MLDREAWDRRDTVSRPSRTLQRNKMATARVLSVLWRWRCTNNPAPADALVAFRLADFHSGANVNRRNNDFSRYFLWFFFHLPSTRPIVVFWIWITQSLIACRLPFWASANAPPPPRRPHSKRLFMTMSAAVCFPLRSTLYPLTEII